MALRAVVIVPALALAAASCALHSTYVAPGASTCPTSATSAESATQSIYFIGDAGWPGKRRFPEPVLDELARDARANGAERVVVFLGDNVYPSGVPAPGEPGAEAALERLDAQITAFTGRRGIRIRFVPGNHDYREWQYSAVERQNARIRETAAATGVDAALRPSHETPFDPAEIERVGKCSILFVDSHAWLVAARSTEGAGAHESALRAAAEKEHRDGRRVIVAAHYPLASHGRHGGYFDWRDHLFPLNEPLDCTGYLIPLPVIGSIYTAWRATNGLGLEEDLASEKNQSFVTSMRRALAGAPVALYASGHEHSLQILRQDGLPPLLVSGAGYLGRQQALTTGDDTLFASPRAGYFRLDFTTSGGARLECVEIDGRRAPRREFATPILPVR